MNSNLSFWFICLKISEIHEDAHEITDFRANKSKTQVSTYARLVWNPLQKKRIQ